jgi:hypothetical protein
MLGRRPRGGFSKLINRIATNLLRDSARLVEQASVTRITSPAIVAAFVTGGRSFCGQRWGA